MSECDHDNEEELKAREARLHDARALFAMTNHVELFDKLIAAAKARDVDTIATLIGTLPPMILDDGEAANTGINMAFLTGTRRLMRDHPAWLGLRHKARTFYGETEMWAMNLPESPQRVMALAVCMAANEMLKDEDEEKFSA